MDWAQHWFPVLRWLPTYDMRSDLLGDFIAGLTVTAVAAPEAVSYAGIAGLPPAQGLNTGFLAPLAYAAAGGSPQLIVGPTAIMCILTNNALPSSWGGSVVQPATDKEPTVLRIQLAAALAAVVALLQMLMALLRLGGLVSLISMPVVAGFTSGSAILTASSQVSSLLGLPKCVGSGGGSCNVPQAITYVAEHWGAIPWRVPLVSLSCVALLLAVKHAPAYLPAHAATKILGNLAPLVLVCVAVPLNAAYGATFEAWGMEPSKAIPPGLPTPHFPLAGLGGSAGDWGGLVAAAVPLAVIGYMGAVTITKTVARQYGPYATYPAQELWGQVAANAACAIGGGLPVTGSFSRTAVNAASGARTGLASALTGGLMAVSLVTLTGVLAQVPSVARSSIVVVAIAKMIELHLLRALWGQDKRDFLVFTVTLLTVICWDAAPGLATGVALSWLLALMRTAPVPTPAAVYAWQASGDVAFDTERGKMPLESPAASSALASAAAEACDAVAASHAWSRLDSTRPASANTCVVLQLGPDAQFGSAERLAERVREAAEVGRPAVMVLECAQLSSADTTGARALLQSADDVRASVGHYVPFVLAGVQASVLSVLERVASQLDSKGYTHTGADAVVSRYVHDACNSGEVTALGSSDSMFVCDSSASALGVARTVCAVRTVVVTPPSQGDDNLASARARLQPFLREDVSVSLEDQPSSGKGAIGGAYAQLLPESEGSDDGEDKATEALVAQSGGSQKREIRGVPTSPVALQKRKQREARTLDVLFSLNRDSGSDDARRPSACAELVQIFGLDETTPMLGRA